MSCYQSQGPNKEFQVIILPGNTEGTTTTNESSRARKIMVSLEIVDSLEGQRSETHSFSISVNSHGEVLLYKDMLEAWNKVVKVILGNNVKLQTLINSRRPDSLSSMKTLLGVTDSTCKH